MKELLPTVEKVSKERAIDAYKKFVEQGIKSPDALDLDDPEVIEANNLFEKWRAGLEDSARSNFEATKFYLDAGFDDPDYMLYVLSWLYSDANDLGKDANDLELTQLRNDMANEMRKIHGLLREPKA
ncbi:MAG: hypothetical protein A3B99_00570 [Candidatus Yanofskybacteria bacterium RIFCSPHIGHO2_02_FULL_44_12b]|uniref:Uncharacterized protein n=2 Tax=Candidatus Yanofskyibacteriota TaxID=1752733 RepID=A0A1F8GLE7_9BACT|nr:MAG: hypothetical protein UW79_C0016G0019 [Candidatus Yanofskybacteria bacterium GW2011_GWA2_44_9]OGN05136.1 MAG: hypothetical protein A2659_02255 [Candidatus Yanofskybacteria bacterium RIFCSPHIGHO2_01_FULL_44_24]OGN15974.1 MAG: hypothetical protein A3B99_00570 [Candidatus Yanofskybacteria bacterium RIFCSPHIGHO2_02_FULL_44_12b]OGN25486.1 MAG: hypothetical protein A2925_02020 [Candidatus Yanofskybacteria bacterium RIFCSPLOWO2_01_FULL_44_22]